MMRQTYIPIICFLMLCQLQAASADDIYFTGSSIPLRECRIEQISAGQLIYIDQQGRRHRRTLDEIDALTFDELPQLIQAEQALRQEDDPKALLSYLQALLDAQQEMHKLWLHVRLNRYYDLRGQYVEAAAHAASVFMIQNDPYWRKLEPVSNARTTTYPALHESFHLLQRADRRIGSGALVPVIDRMLTAVQVMYERESADYSGRPPAAGNTISGFRKEDIRAGRLQEVNDSSPTAESPAPDTTKHDQTPTRSITTSGKRLSPREVDALLDAGEFTLALTACRHIARDSGERDLSQFLRQFGQALMETDHADEAAVMLTRCMVLFPEAEHAAWCAIASASIYRDTYHQTETARRLLQRALEQAEKHNWPELVQLAHNELQLLDN